MKTSATLALLALVFLSGCIGPGRRPHAFLPPIAEEYYACDKCGSLHGGIYGKGPIESFASAAAPRCWHRWQQVTRADFQRLASERFPTEWEKAGWYVKRPELNPNAESAAPRLP